MIAQAKASIRRLLPKNAFARAVSVLVSGTAGAHVLTILAAPLLTRLYTPGDFGLVAVYVSLLGLITVIASLRYELAIPLPEDDAKAANAAALSLILVGISTLLTGLLVVLLSDSIATMLGVPTLAGYLWLLPLGVLLSGAYNVFNYWSIRTKRFTAIAGTRVRQALATITIQLTAFKLGGIVLLFGQVAGHGIGTISLGRPALANSAFNQVSWQGIRKVAVQYRRFPVFNTPAGLLNTAGQQLPPLLFSVLFSVSAAGFYALAHRVLSTPASMVGQAVGNVFLSKGIDAHRENKLGELVDQVHERLAFMAILPTLLLIVVAPELFTIVFGEQWYIAGEIVQWLAPMIYMQFCTAALTVFIILEKQHLSLYLQSMLFLSRLVSILIGYSYGDLITGLAIYGISSSVIYGIFLYAKLRFSKAKLGGALLVHFKYLFISILCVLPMLVVLNINVSDVLVALGMTTTIILTLAYYLLLSSKINRK